MGNGFTYLMAALDVVAAVAYGIQGDWPRTIYWLLGAFMVVTTTLMR